MSTVNKVISSMDGGLFKVSLDYDSSSLRVTALHIVNNSSRSYTISVTGRTNGKNYTYTVPANSSLDPTISTGTSSRLQLSTTTSGKLDGVEWSVY